MTLIRRTVRMPENDLTAAERRRLLLRRDGDGHGEQRQRKQPNDSISAQARMSHSQISQRFRLTPLPTNTSFGFMFQATIGLARALRLALMAILSSAAHSRFPIPCLRSHVLLLGTG